MDWMQRGRDRAWARPRLEPDRQASRKTQRAGGAHTRPTHRLRTVRRVGGFLPRPCQQRWRIGCPSRCLRRPGTIAGGRPVSRRLTGRVRGGACCGCSLRRRRRRRSGRGDGGVEREASTDSRVAAGDYGEWDATVLGFDLFKYFWDRLELGEKFEVEGFFAAGDRFDPAYGGPIAGVEGGDDLGNGLAAPRIEQSLIEGGSSIRPGLASRR